MRNTIKPSDENILFETAIERMLKRTRRTIEQNLAEFPHYADQNTGEWTTSKDGFWTGGFWPGILWLAGYYSGERHYWEEAAQWTSRLEARVESDSVFRGFLFYFAGSVGAELANNSEAAELAVSAAYSLSKTFNPTVGLMPLGATAEESHAVGENETNIDSLSASLVVGWAALYKNDENLRKIAISHALSNARFCVRTDGSVCQSASFNTENGELLRTYTHKGYHEASTWTRAQAWAMLGYAYLAGVFPEHPRLIEIAEQVCDWWIANIPDDLIAYWDFDAPHLPETKRDSSGTAIACAAFLKLSACHPDREKARRYHQAAKSTVAALCSTCLTPTHIGDERPEGILTQGCFDPQRGTAIESELIWGDYFLLESLGVLTRTLPLGTHFV
jgi:unsaturated chondroitin disaccharide hydrolase